MGQAQGQGHKARTSSTSSSRDPFVDNLYFERVVVTGVGVGAGPPPGPTEDLDGSRSGPEQWIYEVQVDGVAVPQGQVRYVSDQGGGVLEVSHITLPATRPWVMSWRRSLSST